MDGATYTDHLTPRARHARSIWPKIYTDTLPDLLVALPTVGWIWLQTVEILCTAAMDSHPRLGRSWLSGRAIPAMLAPTPGRLQALSLPLRLAKLDPEAG